MRWLPWRRRSDWRLDVFCETVAATVGKSVLMWEFSLLVVGGDLFGWVDVVVMDKPRGRMAPSELFFFLVGCMLELGLLVDFACL